MKNGKRQTAEEIEQTRQKEENSKYIGLLEACTIKPVDTKEKLQKINLEERESFSKRSSAAVVLSNR